MRKSLLWHAPSEHVRLLPFSRIEQLVAVPTPHNNQEARAKDLSGSGSKVFPVNKSSPSGARCFGGDPTMLRIERVTDGGSTVLKLSGRIAEEYLAQLHSEIEQPGNRPKLDLRDVSLVDRSTVRFLIRCESQGIELMNCPLYIQEWISMERRRAVSRPDND